MVEKATADCNTAFHVLVLVRHKARQRKEASLRFYSIYQRLESCQLIVREFIQNQMHHADQMFQWELLVILQLGAEWKAKKRRSGFVKKRQGRAEGWKGWDWFFNQVFCPPASLTRPTLRIVQPQWRRQIQKRFCTSKTGLGCHAFYNGGLWIKSRCTIVKEAL